MSEVSPSGAERSGTTKAERAMPAPSARTVAAGALLLLGGIIGVIDASIQHSVFYFLGIGGATLVVAGFVDGTKLRYRGPGTAMLVTFLTAQFLLKWLPDKPLGMTQAEFLGFCYAVAFAGYGFYVLVRETVRLRSRSQSF